jgi:hypothetical protein
MATTITFITFITLAHSLANKQAVALPIPEIAPVIIATS